MATTHSVPYPSGELDTHDTAAPPLPPWLKGFLVTSKGAADVRRAGEECARLCNDLWFRVGYNEHVPSSMVVEGKTEVPFQSAESLLVPGSPGSVFVALRPDNTTCDVRLLAEALIEEADKVGAEGWTKTKHTQRIIPVERIAPETELEALARDIVEAHFPALAPADRPSPLSTFRVHYEEHTPAMHLHKLDVEKMISDMVPGDSYKVCLKKADYTILCIVAGGSAMMSVVKGYDDKMHHFHIHSAPTSTA